MLFAVLIIMLRLLRIPLLLLVAAFAYSLLVNLLSTPFIYYPLSSAVEFCKQIFTVIDGDMYVVVTMKMPPVVAVFTLLLLCYLCFFLQGQVSLAASIQKGFQTSAIPNSQRVIGS